MNSDVRITENKFFKNRLKVTKSRQIIKKINFTQNSIYSDSVFFFYLIGCLE